MHSASPFFVISRLRPKVLVQPTQDRNSKQTTQKNAVHLLAPRCSIHYRALARGALAPTTHLRASEQMIHRLSLCYSLASIAGWFVRCWSPSPKGPMPRRAASPTLLCTLATAVYHQVPCLLCLLTTLRPCLGLAGPNHALAGARLACWYACRYPRPQLICSGVVEESCCAH